MHDWNHQSNFSSSPTKSNVPLQRKIKKTFSPRENGHIKKNFLTEKEYKYSIVSQCVLLTFTQTSTSDDLYGILN